MWKCIACIVATIHSLLFSFAAYAEVREIRGEPITNCAGVMGKWRHDSRPFLEIDLTITTPTCGFSMVARALFRGSKRYKGQGYVTAGTLVLSLKEKDEDIGYFLLKKRHYNLGGIVTYAGEGMHEIELWWILTFPSDGL